MSISLGHEDGLGVVHRIPAGGHRQQHLQLHERTGDLFRLRHEQRVGNGWADLTSSADEWEKYLILGILFFSLIR